MVRITFIFLILLTTSSFAGLQYLSKQLVSQTSFELVSSNFMPDTTTTNSLDDAIDENVAIGFSFPFNGQTYTQLNIDSNGHISFNNIGSDYTNSSLPDANRGASIFPYWDDLNPSNGGTVKYGTVGNGSSKHFIVSWNNIPHYPSDGSYSFQLVLYADGTIRFRYDSSSDVSGSSATIGVQENSNDYEQHSYDSNTDLSKDILYVPNFVSLFGTVPTCTTPIAKIGLKTYSTSTTYPSNANEYQTLINTYAVDNNLFGSGYVDQINGSGNPYGSNNDYLSMFDGYMYFPETGMYKIGIDGDDAVEVYMDNVLITGWYGGHGRARQAKYIKDVYATEGWHKVAYHHQERAGGDNYYLYWQRPVQSSMVIVPSSAFFHCNMTAEVTLTKSSRVVSDPVNGTNNPKRIPLAVVEYTLLASNIGELSVDNVILTDTLENNLEWIENSLKIITPEIEGGVEKSLTDASDGDEGSFNGTDVEVNCQTLNKNEVCLLTFFVTVK